MFLTLKFYSSCEVYFSVLQKQSLVWGASVAFLWILPVFLHLRLSIGNLLSLIFSFFGDRITWWTLKKLCPVKEFIFRRKWVESWNSILYKNTPGDSNTGRVGTTFFETFIFSSTYVYFLYVDHPFFVPEEHMEISSLHHWASLTSFELYTHWEILRKPPAGSTCHLLLPTPSIFKTLIHNWILHLLWPWESILYSLQILFPWVLGLYKTQLLNLSAHHLGKKILLTLLHLISSPYGFATQKHISFFCAKDLLIFHLFLGYSLFLSQRLLTLKTIF